MLFGVGVGKGRRWNLFLGFVDSMMDDSWQTIKAARSQKPETARLAH